MKVPFLTFSYSKKSAKERINMEYKDFVQATVSKFSQSSFETAKAILLDEYIKLYVLDKAAVTQMVFAEKVCDYFSMSGLKTGRNFKKQLESYMYDLDLIVSSRIAKVSAQGKKGELAYIPRSRKYYERAIKLRKGKELTMNNLIDYTRIMLCLFSAIIKNKGREIENFDYSLESLNPQTLILAMKQEEVADFVPLLKKKKFENKSRYESDTANLVIAILLLYLITEGKVEE